MLQSCGYHIATTSDNQPHVVVCVCVCVCGCGCGCGWVGGWVGVRVRRVCKTVEQANKTTLIESHDFWGEVTLCVTQDEAS